MSLKDIRLVRDITATVNGVAHELRAGWQQVEQEVADHWMVKALTDNHSTEALPDTRDAQILELSSQLGAMKDELAKANAASATAVVNEQKLADMTNDLAAMTQARDNALTENIALNSKLSGLQAQFDEAAAAQAATQAAVPADGDDAAASDATSDQSKRTRTSK